MRTACLPCVPRAMRTVLALLAVSTLGAPAGASSTLWNWSYSAAGISAGGTFTAADTADASGGFLITAITGLRNGIAITGLQPAGTAIPGNEPFAVDDLVFLRPGSQLTVDGFGYSTADGNFANAFFADFLPSPGYLEFFSAPPFTDGGQGPGDSELPIQFAATPVPEPVPSVLVMGAIALAVGWRRLRKTANERVNIRSLANSRVSRLPLSPRNQFQLRIFLCNARA